MNLLVCGGRHYVNVAYMWKSLDRLAAETPEPGIRLVIDGASDDVTGPYVGADYWAHEWAKSRNIPTARVHAKWESHGRAAGPIRNSDMLATYKPDCVVAFEGGNGTADMVRRAKAASVRTIEL